MRIGILSDTHGLLRDEVIEALTGCDMIFHAGDINNREIINRLMNIAVTYVVRGNNDKDWAADLPEFLDTTAGNLHIFMTHKKKDLPKDLSPYDLVIIGHSHRYVETKDGRTVILNPGSCGPRRFDQEITLAVAETGADRLQIRKIAIPHKEKEK